MKRPHQIPSAIALVLVLVLIPACKVFRELGDDLKFMEKTSVVTARVSNADHYRGIYGLVMEWDPVKGVMNSADYARTEGIGIFGFVVKSRENQYVGAFSDSNKDGMYEPGEPAWIHSDATGRPVPVDFKARVEGALSPSTILPPDLIAAGKAMRNGRSMAEVATGWQIPISLGTVADLDDPKFAAESGADGLWHPASFPLKSGIGIYFLERYDPNRTPVLFVYGAAGSPQDWRTVFRKLDQKRFQIWFYQYPSGRHLDEMGRAMNRGVEVLQGYYKFKRLYVVAHSMGGLVSREAILGNLDDGNRYIKKFVSISSPYGGHEFAGMGVKRAPSVVPSWYDMEIGSPFLNQLFEHRLKGKVEHLLIYGDKAKRSVILPVENDGTVSVESVTRPEAVNDALRVEHYPENHVSILSNPQVIRSVQDFLGE